MPLTRAQVEQEYQHEAAEYLDLLYRMSTGELDLDAVVDLVLMEDF